MSLKTLLTDIPKDLMDAYIATTNQQNSKREDVIAAIIYRNFKVDAKNDSELESLNTKLYRKEGSHLDEWLIEYIEDMIIKSL